MQNESTSGVPSAELLAKAKAGDTRAMSLLFRRHGPELRQWARGRLPRWARGMADTTDVVQDVLLRTFKRIDSFEDRGKGALRGYLPPKTRSGHGATSKRHTSGWSREAVSVDSQLLR